jgi:arylsulfatase A-like enzyme
MKIEILNSNFKRNNYLKIVTIIIMEKVRHPNIEKYFAVGILVSVVPVEEMEAQRNQERPNIILILTDDQGWCDVGFNGSRDILTPNIDNLARQGVVFTCGYVSHPYSSPSRAGIMTGKYQQRFGHEYNVPYEPDNDKMGTPTDEVFIAQLLKKTGYRTCAIGKWHLGDNEKFLPHHRGFDHWFGFSAGGMNYWGIPQNEGGRLKVRRNDELVEAKDITYLTDDFTKETLWFIKENKDSPFFIYLAYNAPHAPNQTTQHYLEKTSHIEYGERSVYGAMVSAVDEGVGRIDSMLTLLGIRSNTLIVFLSDNGGRVESADNRPYRGHKGMLFEGGIRVPFCMSWPEQIPPDMRYDKPVISLDLFATFLSAANITPNKELDLDGVNLLPFIRGENKEAPHNILYWRVAGGEEYAIRKGDFKLVKSAYKNKTFLFNLKVDEMEINDISSENPELFAEMGKLYQEWNNKLVMPLWTDPHLDNVKKEQKALLDTRTKSMSRTENK